MKKIILIFTFVFIFLCYGININAENFKVEISPPHESEEFFNENNIDISNPESMTEITPGQVFSYIWKEFKASLTMPLKSLGMMMLIIILSALLKGTGDTVKNENLSSIYDIITVLVCIGVISEPIVTTLSYVTDTLYKGGDFMLSYIPIFSSIVAAGGNVSSAGVYHVILLGVSEIFLQVSNKIFIPMISVCLAMSVVEAINPTISLSGIINGVKKVSTWGIGFVMTVFVGLLTLQSIIGTSADTVAVKAGKFLVSNFVPVVGGAISDAYTTIRGSLGILRSGVGVFGIIGLAVLVIPPVMSVFSMLLTVNIAGIASGIFDIKQISGFLKNISDILTTAMSLILSFSLMLIIATTVVMMVAMHME